MLKDIVENLEVDNCSYSFDLVAIFCRSSHTVIGEEVLQKLKGWLSPLDPSTNYSIVGYVTFTWKQRPGSWKAINFRNGTQMVPGCGSTVNVCSRTPCVCMSLKGPTILSRFGEERPLVRHSMISPYT